MLTWHNDNARTGQNLQETILTPGNVTPAAFGKLFVISVDGKVDAQPLFVASMYFPARARWFNVLYVVTEHDSAYAFDADTGLQLWKVSLLAAGEVPSDDRGCSQVTPEIGIASTPVIDLQLSQQGTTGGGTMYAVSMSKDMSGHYHHRLHALDLISGAERFGGPVEIQATYPGSGAEGNGGLQTFDPKQHKERSALVLVNGVVYTSWGSHCDFSPYTGWVIGYNAATLARVSILNLTPNGGLGGMWNAGSGPAADAAGNLFLLTGNGTFDTSLNTAGFPANGDYGNAFVKLATGGTLTVADYFTMTNTTMESNGDVDLGSGGVMLLPSRNDAHGRPRSLAVGAGKDSHMYVVDQNNLGKYTPGTNAIYQDLPSSIGSVFSSPAWFAGTLYYGAVNDALKAFPFTNGAFGSTAASHSAISFGYPGSTPSISANGASNGIVWAAENGGTAVLHAYDASDLSHELYNSNQAPSGSDHFGAGNKFVVPTVTNGKVYVGTTNGVGVFGLRCSYSILPQGPVVSPLAGQQALTTTATSGCAWTAVSNASWLTIVSGSSGTGNGTVSYSIEANSSLVPRTGTLVIAGQTITVTQLGTAGIATSLSTASGSGPFQTFAAVFWDSNGYQSLSWGEVLFAVSPSGGGQPFCLVHYDSPGNALWLLGDAGFFIGPITPGAPSRLLENNACAVNGQLTSVTKSGVNVSLNLAVSFKSAFQGSKNTYLRALGSSTGGEPGFVAQGTWNVTAPSADSMTLTPSSGSASAQYFSATFTDPGAFGGQIFGWAQMLFAVAPDGGGQPFCDVHYDRSGNGLWLFGDDGFFLGPITPGMVSTALQNSYCAIDTLNSSAVNGTNGLQLTAAVSFKPPFAGSKNVYLRQLDALNRDTGMQPAGTWTVTDTVAPAWVRPAAGTGATQMFNATYYHPNGTSSIQWTELLFASAPDGGGQPFCLVYYDQAGGGLWLYGDAGAFIGPVTPGVTSNALQTSSCGINTAASSSSVSGGSLTLNVVVTFHGAFHGATNTYLRALDTNGNDTGWQQKGAWMIP